LTNTMIGEELPIWWDEPADAFTNMAADELLAAEADRRGCLVVRIYGWEPASVSLGAFQEIATARAYPAIAGVPLVRRPSGGGALVHGTDLTYAAAVPRRHPWGETAQAFYDAFHAALVAELRDRGIAARQYRSAGAADARAERLLCFERRAEGDVVVARSAAAEEADDPKIMGSAQRRLAGVILQHGSLLLRANPAVGQAARHAGLLDLSPQANLDVRSLAEAWLTRVARACAATAVPQGTGFRVAREADIAALAARFRDARWIARR
jgi:lipoate-protein ligase A